MVHVKIKKLYNACVPRIVKVKIAKIRNRRRVNFSEKYFECHMNNFMFDDERKTDVQRIFSLLRKNGYDMLPELDSSVRKKYFTRELTIRKDSNTGLFYVLVDNKKLFYKFGMNEHSVRRCFNLLSLEQDYASPHRYFTNDHYFVGVVAPVTKQVKHDSFGVDGGVVIDVGAAEGNFALSVVEKVSKLYIVESDAGWCEALRQTFLPYKEKVEIIQKCLSDVDDDNNITLATLFKKYGVSKVDFLKMDIEGYEKQALRGGMLDCVNFVAIAKMAICVYHESEDEFEISNFVKQHKYKFYLTDGFTVISDLNNVLRVRKGVLRAYK